MIILMWIGAVFLLFYGVQFIVAGLCTAFFDERAGSVFLLIGVLLTSAAVYLAPFNITLTTP